MDSKREAESKPLDPVALTLAIWLGVERCFDGLLASPAVLKQALNKRARLRH